MATKKATYKLNDENVNAQLISKSNIVQPVKTVKRTALGEVGNHFGNIRPVQKNGFKQNEVISKKSTTILPAKKDLPKVFEATKKKPLIKQENVLKAIPTNTNKDVTKKTLSSLSTISTKRGSITNPDENIKSEPQMVPEYLLDIFAYLRDLEAQFPIRKNFLESHESTPKMRAILVNWLVEVHMNFNLSLETLHLCIAIIDRYLQENKKVGRSTLQLVGTSAMLIACKYEEIFIPDLEDFEYICDNTYSKRQILKMEIEILKKLDFSLGRPLTVQFLRRYTKIAQAQLEHHILGKYILELALLEYELSHIKPSLQAAAACCLSMGILNDIMDLQKLWTPTLVHYTTYDYCDFRAVLIEFALLLVQIEKSKYQAIRKKYASAKFAKISLNSKLNGPLVKKLTASKK